MSCRCLVEACQWFSIVSVRWGLCLRQCLFVAKHSGCSVLLTYFRFDLVSRRKVAIRLYMFFFDVCVCYVVKCVILCTSGEQNPSLCPCFLHSWQQCVFNGHFHVNCQPPQSQLVDGGFLCVKPDDVEFCSFWMVLIVGVVPGTDCCTICESCLRFTNPWHSNVICCRVMSGFCSIFDRILVQTSASLADIQIYDT